MTEAGMLDSYIHTHGHHGPFGEGIPKKATYPYLNRDVGQFGRSRRVLLESTLRHVERFGGVVERPFERDGRRKGVHLAQNVGGLVARHAVDFLLVGSAQRLVCGVGVDGGRDTDRC